LALSSGRFVLIINGLGLAHQPRCVPGAAFGQAVLTYFQRGGGHSPARRQAKLQLSYGCHGATCKPGFRPGCLFHCRGGVAPASIQTRQCFRQHANQASGRAVCSAAGGGSTSQHWAWALGVCCVIFIRIW
jgi:hypothetical protein